MPLDPRYVAAQIDPLVEKAREGIRTDDPMFGEYYGQPGADASALFTRMMAVIARLTPIGSTYQQQADDVRAGGDPVSRQVIPLAGILEALRDDYAAGYMRTVEELIHSGVFSDFLEMANELQTKGFKDPAAVLAGSVLEEHLRKLAVAHAVAIEKPDGKPQTANKLNADLAKSQAYNKLVESQVKAWFDIRNAAAHAKYDDYDHAQVAALIDGVRSFMVNHPA